MKKKAIDFFKNIKLLVLDVDGVLTKGEIIYDDDGRELKSFNVKDGLGVALLGKAGIPTILLTAKDGKVVHRRGHDMKVLEVIAGVLPKEKMLPVIEEKYQVKRKDICFIGDDWIDIGMIENVGLGVAVNDAPDIVKRSAKYVTKRNGGEGAVREVVDLIIKAQKLEKKIFAWIKNPFCFFFMGLLCCLPLTGHCDNTVKDFFLSNYKNDGGVDWDMKGDQGVIRDQDIHITKMTAKYYTDKDTVVITSDKARLNKVTKDGVLKKHVKIVNGDGTTLTTSLLDWYKNKNLVRTREAVQIKKDDMQINARGMNADTALKNVDFLKEVHTQVIDPKTKGLVVITCDGQLNIEYAKGQAVYHDNVVVTHDASRIYSDIATAYFDSQQKTVTRVVCEGHVKIIKDDNTTLAKKATFLRAEGRVLLEGRPHLVYHPSTATAKEVEF